MTESSLHHVVIVALESSYGVDAIDALFQGAPATITYLAVNSDSVGIAPAFDQFVPSRVRSSISGVQHSAIASHNTVEYTGPLKAKAAAGAGNEEPFYSPLLRAAGFDVAIVGGVSATYNLQTNNDASCTIYDYRRDLTTGDWRLIFTTGVVGNMTFNFEVGGEATWTFSGVGLAANDETVIRTYFDANDDPALRFDGSAVGGTPTGLRDDAERNICRSMTTDYGAVSYPVSTLTLDLALTAEPVKDVNGAVSISQAVRTRADATNSNGSLQISTTDGSVAYDDALTRWKDNSAVALDVDVASESSSFGLAVDAPIVQLFGPPGLVDLAGSAGFDIPIFLNGDFASAPFGNNELTFAYT